MRLGRGPQKPPPPGVEIAGSHASGPWGSRPEDDPAVPSIDAILTRARPRVDRALRRREIEIIEREQALREGEKEFQQALRESRERTIALNERERECSEREMLLEIRENNVSLRESLLTPGTGEPTESGEPPRKRYEELCRKLEDREAWLRARADEVDRKERELAERAKALDTDAKARAAGASKETPSAPDLAKRLDEIVDRERMLEEREAFIEQSENVLFNRAQELQELEAQLGQMADDGTVSGDRKQEPPPS